MAVSIKRAQIEKARSNVILVVSVAVVIVVFCLMSTKALLSQAAYQRRVINARHAALAQLETNETNAKQLVTHYNQVFEGTNPTNVLGGQNTKNGTAIPPNGDNARIVLDALPSKYDFPALLSSVSYIMTKNNIQNANISGDDATATANNSATSNPQPVEIQLTVSGNSSYAGVQAVVSDFERSIRPFNITAMKLNGGDSNMSFSLNLTTYYQPAKSLELTTKKVQ